MDDSAIIELYNLRDEAAIRNTKQKYGDQLQKISLNIVEDTPTAEECENDTYLKTWNSIPPHQPVNYFFAYLAKIIRQLSLDRCKERNRQKRYANVVELSYEMEQCIPSRESTEAQLESMALENLLSDFLRNLPDEKRNIFIRRYWYADSVADISKMFNVTESKVKTTLFRCRKELKNILEKEAFL